jgi:hypothetical protein
MEFLLLYRNDHRSSPLCFCYHPGRGIFIFPQVKRRFFFCFDDQTAIGNKSILFAVGIILKLVISPSAEVLTYFTSISQIKRPAFRVDLISIKFIGPHELIIILMIPEKTHPANSLGSWQPTVNNTKAVKGNKNKILFFSWRTSVLF